MVGFEDFRIIPPDAFGPYNDNNSLTLSVEGVSITYGTATPRHIWTYACGFSLATTLKNDVCPYNTGSIAKVPPYVGSDYYCETGYHGNDVVFEFFPNDVLWDGKQCDGLEAPCCTQPNMPWFTKHRFIRLRNRDWKRDHVRVHSVL